MLVNTFAPFPFRRNHPDSVEAVESRAKKRIVRYAEGITQNRNSIRDVSLPRRQSLSRADLLLKKHTFAPIKPGNPRRNSRGSIKKPTSTKSNRVLRACQYRLSNRPWEFPSPMRPSFAQVPAFRIRGTGRLWRGSQELRRFDPAASRRERPMRHSQTSS